MRTIIKGPQARPYKSTGCLAIPPRVVFLQYLPHAAGLISPTLRASSPPWFGVLRLLNEVSCGNDVLLILSKLGVAIEIESLVR